MLGMSILNNNEYTSFKIPFNYFYDQIKLSKYTLCPEFCLLFGSGNIHTDSGIPISGSNGKNVVNGIINKHEYIAIKKPDVSIS